MGAYAGTIVHTGVCAADNADSEHSGHGSVERADPEQSKQGTDFWLSEGLHAMWRWINACLLVRPLVPGCAIYSVLYGEHSDSRAPFLQLSPEEYILYIERDEVLIEEQTDWERALSSCIPRADELAPQ